MSHKPLAVVTVAFRGLGLETCRQLAATGHQVILTARRNPEGQSAADSLRANGLEVGFHPLDVTDEASITQLATYIRDNFGRLDVLVNNADILPDKSPGSEGASNANLSGRASGHRHQDQLGLPRLGAHGCGST